MLKVLKKFGLKTSIIAMALIVVAVGFILVYLLDKTSKLVSDMLFSQSQTANGAFSSLIEDYKEQALERAEMIAASDDVIKAVEGKDSAALIKTLKNLSSGMDLVTLCDAEGIVLARTHSDKTGDSVISQNAISAALTTGTGISTIEPGTVIGLSTRGSAAIKDHNGKIIGALTCGHDLSQTKYVDNLKKQSNCEATFFAGDERMNTTLVDEQGNRVVGTKASDQVIETVLKQGQDFHTRLNLFGKLYECYYSPLMENNQAMGMLFTGVLVEDAVNQERGMVVFITAAIFMLLIAILITAAVIRWISKKIHWYEEILDSIPFPISVTDMNMNWTFINKPVEQLLNTSRSDILGKPCSTWGAAICGTDNCGINCLNKGKTETFFEQAGMDFQVDSSYLTDNKQRKLGHIEIVQDISEMVKKQKAETNLVHKISKVSKAFVAASQDIANSASALASNSMEQSATIEQLSGSVSEMAEKTKISASMAGKAAELADTIKINAEKGSVQMDKMMQAVEEINQSSQSISNVIKAIDDIAFQTNILALNAAVEAARAGQHGKGFAVVADEVRNLAAKSAAAAKNTGSLIANSMDKAQLGVQIATETASSLKEIVSGIDESSQLVKNISNESAYQSTAIGQLDRGIEQVAHNVQQTSATAEESAAVSEEVSGQSALLRQLIDDFIAKEESSFDQ